MASCDSCPDKGRCDEETARRQKCAACSMASICSGGASAEGHADGGFGGIVVVRISVPLGGRGVVIPDFLRSPQHLSTLLEILSRI